MKVLIKIKHSFTNRELVGYVMINCMVGIEKKKKKNKKKTDEESKEGRLGNLVFYIGDLW